jgi:two-component system chemotaxis sensor kinase CheA
MAGKDDEFLKKLFAAFKIEAEEHLKAIADGLLELERIPEGGDGSEILETVYREAHSLKGAARSVNMAEIEALCQSVESIFAALRAGRLQASTELFDAMHRATDTMSDLLTVTEGMEIQPILELLDRLESGAEPVAVRGREPPTGETRAETSVDRPEPKPSRGTDTQEDPEGTVVDARRVQWANRGNSPRKVERRFHADTIRIAVAKLDPLLRRVGEMVSVKLTSTQRVTDLSGLVGKIDLWRQKWADVSSNDRTAGKLLVDRRRGTESSANGGRSAKIAEFLAWNEEWIKDLESGLRTITRAVETDAGMHSAMVDDLLEDMMNVLMLPCSALLEIFPKLVRDLAGDRGKKVNLLTKGGELEIDRRILDEMKDPLIHLVRNCIDHGIETPEERGRSGKPEHGTVTVSMSQISGNQIELVVSDDGAGIDTGKVREAAFSRGLLSEQDRRSMEEEEAVSLVFRSDVSTSPIVSTISGRGLGLAIVREKVEALGGSISVATAPRAGASFRILLPVTLSTFRGILIRAHAGLFIIPTASVERVARIPRDVIKTVGNRETIIMDGHAVPLLRLGDILEMARPQTGADDSPFINVIILRSGETLVSFRVDDILQEQEVLVKALGKQLSRVRNTAGATVLGSGELAPILSVPDLIKSALKRNFRVRRPTVEIEELSRPRRSILIVEDSITSRMLLKNILESAGYDVRTSVDGADAWTALNRDRFDLVVSDVEMPNMDGFELTASIREDEKLHELPVVLVTSLGSREDRERGIEVGANAYIAKSGFDRNNLIETVERLI